MIETAYMIKKQNKLYIYVYLHRTYINYTMNDIRRLQKLLKLLVSSSAYFCRDSYSCRARRVGVHVYVTASARVRWKGEQGTKPGDPTGR